MICNAVCLQHRWTFFGQVAGGLLAQANFGGAFVVDAVCAHHCINHKCSASVLVCSSGAWLLSSSKAHSGERFLNLCASRTSKACLQTANYSSQCRVCLCYCGLGCIGNKVELWSNLKRNSFCGLGASETQLAPAQLKMPLSTFHVQHLVCKSKHPL